MVMLDCEAGYKATASSLLTRAFGAAEAQANNLNDRLSQRHGCKISDRLGDTLEVVESCNMPICLL